MPDDKLDELLTPDRRPCPHRPPIVRGVSDAQPERPERRAAARDRRLCHCGRPRLIVEFTKNPYPTTRE